MLVSPTDVDASRETPYFKRLSGRFGALRAITGIHVNSYTNMIEPIIAPRYNSVESALETVGLSPEDIDYITFDHMHTQNVTKCMIHSLCV